MTKTTGNVFSRETADDLERNAQGVAWDRRHTAPAHLACNARTEAEMVACDYLAAIIEGITKHR